MTDAARERNHSQTVRRATTRDGAACAAIYAPYVVETAISFELEPPDAEEMGRRIDAALLDHDWLVVDEDGEVTAYAYAGPHKTRGAYRWTCELSVYVHRERCGDGLGRLLYRALLERLAARGYRTATAGMTLPNEASVALHRSLGFEPVGVFRSVGFKLGRWHDVAYVQRRLGTADGPDDAAPPPITPA